MSKKCLHRNVYVPSEITPELDSNASKFVTDFISELELKANEIHQDFMMPTRWRLLDTARNLPQHNPTQVYLHLTRCIAYEQELLYQAEQPIEKESVQVTRSVEALTVYIRETEEALKSWLRKNESFRADLYDLTMSDADVDMDGNISSQERETSKIVRELKQSALDMLSNQLGSDREKLIDRMRVAFEQAQGLTTSIIDKHLKQWKLSQKVFGGSFALVSLDTMQTWFERLAESLWSIGKYVRTMQGFLQDSTVNGTNSVGFLREMQNRVTITLKQLIEGSFIIDQQPPQVLKTNVRFAATARLLVGNVLSIRINNPEVKVSIVSDLQAQSIAKSKSFTGTAVGEILNGSCQMDYSESTHQMVGAFRNMQMKNFKRPSRRSVDCVADEKFALWFQSSVTVGDLKLKVQEMSLPIVVIVHAIQEPQAWATIFWDNSFAAANRAPFSAPDQVSWKQFSEALDHKFFSACERNLTPDNLHFLSEKVLKANFASPIPDDTMISWSAFCKENLPDRSFTFWEWFHAATRVTRDYLRGPWSAGYINGFCNKLKVDEILNDCAHGTFMLRFSDSELGEYVGRINEN